MSRFYQTAERKYVDDFVYQPPIELLAGILQKEDARITKDFETIDLMGNLPIESWEYDKELAKGIQDEVKNKVEEYAERLRTNPLDKEASRGLKRYALELEQRAVNGDLRNIQDNLVAYKTFETKLAELTDPALREKLKQEMVNEYKQNNQQFRETGQFGNVFEPGELHDTQNTLEDWLSSSTFKNMGIDVNNIKTEKVGNKWIISTIDNSKTVTKEDLQKNFKAYVQSEQEKLKGYGGFRQKYIGEQWLDENGNLSFDQDSHLGNILENLDTFAYSETTKGNSYQRNPYYEITNNNKSKGGGGSNTSSEAFRVNPTTANLAMMNKEVAKKHEALQYSLNFIKKAVPGLTDEEIKAHILMNKNKDDNYKNMAAQVEDYESTSKQYGEASYSYFEQVMGVDGAAVFDESLSNASNNEDWHLPLADGNVTDKGYKIFELPNNQDMLASLKTIAPEIYGGMYRVDKVEIDSKALAIPRQASDVSLDTAADWKVAQDVKIHYYANAKDEEKGRLSTKNTYIYNNLDKFVTAEEPKSGN
jgi:hypothetical protein